MRDPRRGQRLLLDWGRLLGPNISPVLGKQLILELEIGVALGEGLPWLPGGIIRRETLPLHEYFPGALLESCPSHPNGSQDHPTIVDGWQGRRGRRRVAMEGLQRPHMEDVVEA